MVCLIPARGGSKSIPLKNITPVNGKPLIWWVLNSAVDSQLELIYVSTDSDEIKNVVESFGFDKVSVIYRSKENSTDEATTESVIEEFSIGYDYDDLMIIQPTSPLLTTEHINGAIDTYKRYPHDSLVSLIRQHNFRWEIDDNFHLNPKYDLNNRPRRQDHDGYLVENGALYITSSEAFLNSGCRVSGGIGYYIMPPYTAYEIDDPEDIIIVEELLRKYG